MKERDVRKSWLYWVCLGLEWTLLFYLCMVPMHVYFFPELWAVQVVEFEGEDRVWTEPRLFVESRPLPQVTDVSDTGAPIALWRFYLLALGFVVVKLGRVGPLRAWRNVKRLGRFLG